MLLELVTHTCAVCGEHFVAPEPPEASYGEFLLRSSSGFTVALDALAEPGYKEVDQLLAANSRTSGLNDASRAGVLMRLYGELVCDPAPDGTVFVLGAFPPCPCCGSQRMKSWAPLVPVQVVDTDVAAATQNHWSTLSTEQKAAALDSAVRGMQPAP